MGATLRQGGAALLLAIAWGIFAAEWGWADDDALLPQLTRILDVGWGESFRSVEPAEEEFQRAKTLAPTDPRAPYALALVNIKHRKYSEATKLLDDVVSLEGRHLPAREAKIWIDMLLQRHDSALAQMEQLGRLLKTDDQANLSLETESQQREAARFVGRMIAFLEGPADKAANERVAKVKEGVWMMLSTEVRDEFASGHAAVFDRFSALLLTGEKTKQETKVEQEKNQEREAGRLSKERQELYATSKALEERSLHSREDLDKYLSEIDRQLAPLYREYSQLSDQASSLRQQINGVDLQISQIWALHQAQCGSQRGGVGLGGGNLGGGGGYGGGAKGNSTPAGACTHLTDISRLGGIRSTYVSEYRGLEDSANQVYSQGASLVQSRERAVHRYNDECKKIGREQINLSQADKRFVRDQERNRKPPTGNSVPVYVLSQKARALTTYNPFPLEEAKRWLLAKRYDALDAYRALLMSVGRLPEESKYRLDGDSRVTSHDSVLIFRAGRRAMW